MVRLLSQRFRRSALLLGAVFVLITVPAVLSGAAQSGTSAILFAGGRFCYDHFDYRTASALFRWAVRIDPDHAAARKHLTMTGWLLGAEHGHGILDPEGASLLLGCTLEKSSIAEVRSRLRHDIALGDAAYETGAFDHARVHYRHAEDTVRWFPYDILDGMDRRFQRRLRVIEQQDSPRDG